MAVTSAVANGFKKFKAIVLTTDMDDFKWVFLFNQYIKEKINKLLDVRSMCSGMLGIWR